MQIPNHIRSVYESSTCLYTKEEVKQAMEKMAQQIHDTLGEANPICLCVMIGGMIPTSGILEHIDFPLELDYIHATRYRGNTSGGEITWKYRPSSSLKDRVVLIVDDILDGGITLQEIVNYCQAEGAAKIYTAVLVDKPESRLPGGLAQADFTGLNVGKHYIFGCGMDYKNYLRNVPGIYAVSKEFL